jgi:ABC-2 type transport system permease protein
MSDARLVLLQARYSLTALLRTPRALVFSVIFPPLILVIFNALYSAGGNPVRHFDGITLDSESYFTAGLMAYAVALQAFSSLAITLTTQRESGQLKRYRGTPVPAWTFIGALVVRSIALVATIAVVMVAVGTLYGASLPAGGIVGLVVYLVLGTTTMCSLGIALTAVAPTAEAASTIAPFSIVLLAFVSGVFVPIDQLGHTLADVGRVFPLAHLADGLQRSFAATGGTGLNGSDVFSLSVWAVAGVIVAVRRFRWEPIGAAS